MQVTLVALCFRQYGGNQLTSWLKPFQEEFAKNPCVRVLEVRLGWCTRHDRVVWLGF
jgi:hypothetical protein